jgi:hypothetical protein
MCCGQLKYGLSGSRKTNMIHLCGVPTPAPPRRGLSYFLGSYLLANIYALIIHK